MKHRYCGSRAVFDGDLQPLEREELDPYKLKIPLLNRHIMDISELVMPTASAGKRPHTTDGAIAYELW